MEGTKELDVVKKDISLLERKATQMVVTSKEEEEEAAKISGRLKEIGSQIKAQKESITKPANEALKNARLLFKPLEEAYEGALQIVNSKILSYKQKVREEALKEEAKIAQDLESGKIKKIETAERKIENIERVDNTTKTEEGGVQIRKVRKVRIINETLIPRNYLVPDMVAIRRDALGGQEIAGVEVFEEETLANVKA